VAVSRPTSIYHYRLLKNLSVDHYSLPHPSIHPSPSPPLNGLRCDSEAHLKGMGVEKSFLKKHEKGKRKIFRKM